MSWYYNKMFCLDSAGTQTSTIARDTYDSTGTMMETIIIICYHTITI